MAAPKKQFQLSNDPYILGIDSSTRGVAWGIFHDGIPVDYGIVDLTKHKEMPDKLAHLSQEFDIFNSYPIDLMVIEKSIYIGNPQTSRVLSYIVGATMMLAVTHNINNIIDIEPTTWKAYLGYRNITGKFERSVRSKMGTQKGRKFCNELRKSQTWDVLNYNYPWIDTRDDNIADALGISAYAWNTWVKPLEIEISRPCEQTAEHLASLGFIL